MLNRKTLQAVLRIALYILAILASGYLPQGAPLGVKVLFTALGVVGLLCLMAHILAQAFEPDMTLLEKE